MKINRSTVSSDKQLTTKNNACCKDTPMKETQITISIQSYRLKNLSIHSKL